MKTRSTKSELEREADKFVDKNVFYSASNLVFTLTGKYPEIAEEFADILEGPASVGEWNCSECGNIWESEPEDSVCPNCGLKCDNEEDFLATTYQKVFEHWVISDRLADKLETKGEKVARDFFGLVVWARCATGQAISLDSVILEIVAEVRR